MHVAVFAALFLGEAIGSWRRIATGVGLLAGIGTGAGGLLIAQAYRQCEAAVIAPLEYGAMPMAVFWGVIVFQEWPDTVSWAGMTLILASGLFMIYRETRRNRKN